MSEALVLIIPAAIGGALALAAGIAHLLIAVSVANVRRRRTGTGAALVALGALPVGLAIGFGAMTFGVLLVWAGSPVMAYSTWYLAHALGVLSAWIGSLLFGAGMTIALDEPAAMRPPLIGATIATAILAVPPITMALGSSVAHEIPHIAMLVAVVLWHGAVAIGEQAVAMKVRRRMDESARQCFECGYDIQGMLGGRCPECGSPFLSPSPKKSAGDSRGTEHQ